MGLLYDQVLGGKKSSSSGGTLYKSVMSSIRKPTEEELKKKKQADLIASLQKLAIQERGAAVEAEKSPLVKAARAKDAIFRDVTGGYKLGEDIANKRWSSENAGQNIVELAKNSNRGKYGLTAGIVLSPVTAATEFLGTGDRAIRSLQAEKYIEKNKIYDPEMQKQIREIYTGNREFSAPTEKEVLGTAAMTAVEALGASKIQKAAKGIGIASDTAKTLDMASDANKSVSIIKQLKKAKAASEAVAATKIGRESVLKNFAKEALQAGTIGALGTGGLTAADNASGEDIARSAGIGAGFGAILGGGGSLIGSATTNKIANKASAQSDELSSRIKYIQDTISDTRNQKRLAKSLVDAGYIDQANLLLSGQLTPEQTANIVDILNSDSRTLRLNTPEKPQLALPSGNRAVWNIQDSNERGFKPGKVNYEDGAPGFTMKEPTGTVLSEDEKIFMGMAQRGEVGDIKKVLTETEQSINKMIDDEVKYLKSSGGQGVIQGQLIRDESGTVVGRAGRQSKNPQWYRDFYAKNGRKPNNKELREIAIERLRNGYEGEGLPANKDFIRYEKTADSLGRINSELSAPSIAGPAEKVAVSQDIIPVSKGVQRGAVEIGPVKYGYGEVPSFKMETNNPADEIASKVDAFYKSNIDPKNPVVVERLSSEVENMVEAATRHSNKFSAAMDKIPIIKGIRRTIGERNTVLRNSGIKELNDMAARNDVYSIYRGKFMAEAEPIVAKMEKMSTAQKRAIVTEILEAPDRTQLTGLAKEVADLLDARKAMMQKVGLDIGDVENYFPRRLNPKFKDKAKTYIRTEVLDKLTVAKSTGDVDTLKKFGLDMNATAEDMRLVASKEAGNQLDALAFAKQNNIKKSGVEFSRSPVKLPEEYYLEPDLTLVDWNKDTSDRLAASMVFGKNDEKVQLAIDAIDDMGKTGQLTEHDTKFYKEFVENNIRNERFGTDRIQNEAVHKFLTTAKGYVMFSKMSISSITNAGQFQNKANIFGYLNSAKAYRTVNKDLGKYMAKAREYGINVTPVLDDLMSNIYSGGNKNWAVRGAENMLKWNGFKFIETQHRLADIVLAEEFLPKWAEQASKGNKTAIRQLERSGINPETVVDGKLNKEQMALGVKGVVGRADFFVDPKDLQQFATKTELGQTFTQLGKFGLKQTKHIKDEIFMEAAKGNLAPLARWAIGGQFVGYGISEAKNLITGRERETSVGDVIKDPSMILAFAGENIDATGGLGYVADKVEGLKYSKTPAEAIARLFPVGSEGADLLLAGAIGWDALVNKEMSHTDRDRLIKTALKNVPAGNIVSGNLQRFGVMEKYNPAEGQVYDTYKNLGLGFFPDRATAKEIGGKIENRESLADTEMVRAIVNKLYNSKGEEKPLAPKEKSNLLKFLSDNGIDPKLVQRQNKDKGKEESKRRAEQKKQMSEEEQMIAETYSSMKTADRYLRSIGDSIDNHPLLKQRYESLGYDDNYYMW